MKVQVIELNGTRFALPTGMAMKDIQALAGFLISLQLVDYHWVSETKPNTPGQLFFLSDTASVRLATVEALDRDEAEKIYQADRARREAKQTAQQE